MRSIGRLSVGGLALAVSTLPILWLVGPSSGIAPAFGAASPSSTFSPYGAPVDCGHGITQTKPNPPQGFDPMTASDTDLETYGYPPRPTDAATLAKWTAFMTHPINWGGSTCTMAQVAPSIPANIATPVGSKSSVVPAVAADGSACSLNYAGNVDHNQNYTDAQAYIYLPTTVGGASTDSIVGWVGVGISQLASHPLVQAGVSMNPGSAPKAFIEAVPGQQAFPVDFTNGVNLNDIFYVHVNFSVSVAQYHLVDLRTGVDRTYTWTVGGSEDGHAEFIGERSAVVYPPPNQNLSYDNVLASFDQLVFGSAKVAYSGTWYGVGNISHYYLWMQGQDGTKLASVGSIDPTGLSFGDNFLAHGQQDYPYLGNCPG